MCSPPSTRNAAPVRKYLGSRASCPPSSAGEYGSVRVGAFRPGSRDEIESTATAKKAAYVKNSSVERCCVYTAAAG